MTFLSRCLLAGCGLALAAVVPGDAIAQPGATPEVSAATSEDALGTLDGRFDEFDLHVVGGTVDGHAVLWIEHDQGQRLVFSTGVDTYFLGGEARQVRTLDELRLNAVVPDGVAFTARTGGTWLTCTALGRAGWDAACQVGPAPAPRTACERAFRGPIHRAQCVGLEQAYADRPADVATVLAACVGAGPNNDFMRANCLRLGLSHPEAWRAYFTPCMDAFARDEDRDLCLFATVEHAHPKFTVEVLRACAGAYRDRDHLWACALAAVDRFPPTAAALARELAPPAPPSTAEVLPVATDRTGEDVVDQRTGPLRDAAWTDAWTQVRGGRIAGVPFLWVDAYQGDRHRTTVHVDRLHLGKRAVALRAATALRVRRLDHRRITFDATVERTRYRCTVERGYDARCTRARR